MNKLLTEQMLNLDTIEFNFSVIRSRKRKRTITLKITGPNHVTILSPIRTSLSQLRLFLDQKKMWIREKLISMREQEKNTALQLITGEKIPYLGEQYVLRINSFNLTTHSEVCKKVSIIYCDDFNNELIVNISSVSISEDERYQQVYLHLVNWFKQAATNKVAERIAFWSKALNLFPKKWKITSASKRWGSCNANNHININWRIIFAPLAQLDYIIVHELCHIMHKHHQTQFWDLVSTVIPDYKQRKKILHDLEPLILNLF